jgi:hypothetical protein
MSSVSDDTPSRQPRRHSKERRHVGGRRKDDEMPRTDLTKTVMAVIVALVNLAYLVVDHWIDQCNNWFIF